MGKRPRGKKRSKQQQEEDEGEEHELEEENAPMIETDDDDDEPVSKEESAAHNNENASSSFLDTFYGLASMDPSDRSHAARDLLQHLSLATSSASAADASYSLKRLCNALCSGRAGARQGNASALTLLMQPNRGLISHIQEYEKQEGGTENESLSNAAFCRQKLLQATEQDGKQTAQQERDYQFGRLFGIHSLIKSGILGADNDTETCVDVARDVCQLYHAKPWMREPAAHALCLLLLFEKDDMNLSNLATQAIAPELLAKVESLQDLSAEGLSVVLMLQFVLPKKASKALNRDLSWEFPSRLASKEAIPAIADALARTSTVTPPRPHHLVWDVMWWVLSSASEANSVRILSEDKQDVIAALIQHVLLERLLGEGAESSAKATHERRALGLAMVKALVGVEYASSLLVSSAKIRLVLPPTIVADLVLQPTIVQRLLIDVLGAGGKGSGKQQGEHLLKPLASQIASAMVEQVNADDKENGLRFALVQAFLTCDPYFDASTKTRTVQDLLAGASMDGDIDFTQKYKQFLRSRLWQSSDRDNAVVTPTMGVRYLDLLYTMGKQWTMPAVKDKSTKDNSEEMEVDVSTTTEQQQHQQQLDDLLQTMLMTAFFDCRRVEKKPKIGKSNVLSLALELKRESSIAVLPYAVRTISSARFFSLVADLQKSLPTDQQLQLFESIQNHCSSLEEFGAERLDADRSKPDDSDDDEEEEEKPPPNEVISEMTSYAKKHDEDRCAQAMAVLASVLQLQLLSCGGSSIGDNGELPEHDDEEEDMEETTSILSDLYNIFGMYKANSEQFLLGLAELCANVLSAPIGNRTDRGASPKLLRESVRVLWSRGLAYAAESSVVTRASDEVVSVLLGAVGIDPEDNNENGVGNEEEMDEESNDDEEDNSRAESDDDHELQSNVFSKAANLDEMETEETADEPDDDDDDEDIELDPTRLQSLLEQEIDDDDNDEADESMLEHHEGADKALARLIQLKQEARKAGRKALEKVELARRVRCTVLLEVFLSGKHPDGWGKLLRTEMVLFVAIELLRYRATLERSITKEGTGDVTVGEKKALMDRVTALVQTKLLKLKAASVEWETEKDSTEDVATSTAATLFREASNAGSKTQQSLWSSLALWLLRATNEHQVAVATTVFGAAVSDWGNKRSSRFQPVFLDSFLQQAPALAQTILMEPLIATATKAPSSFLQSEAFRLLGVLYGIKSSEETESTNLNDSMDAVLRATGTALGAEEMLKSKRVREVLKTLEKVIKSGNSNYREETMAMLVRRLEQIATDSKSDGIRKSCQKLVDQVQEIMKKDGATTSGGASTPSSGKKKKKNKKGKKK